MYDELDPVLYRRLKLLKKCYSSGQFSELFLYLADDCILEERRARAPYIGKRAVMDFYFEEGAALRKSGYRAEGQIVRIDREKSLGLLLRWESEEETTETMAVVRLDEDDFISKIELRAPEPLWFRPLRDAAETEDDVFLTDEEMPESEQLECVTEYLLERSEDGFAELDSFVCRHEDDDWDGLAEYVFVRAIRTGNLEYVSKHADNFELVNDEGYSEYLYEAQDDAMVELLESLGACERVTEDVFYDCRFASESINDTILNYDKGLQKEAFERYKQAYGLTNETIREILANDDDAPDGRDLEDDLFVLGVQIRSGEICFETKVDGGMALCELLCDLGYPCEFEGTRSPVETCGYYYLE